MTSKTSVLIMSHNQLHTGRNYGGTELLLEEFRNIDNEDFCLWLMYPDRVIDGFATSWKIENASNLQIYSETQDIGKLSKMQAEKFWQTILLEIQPSLIHIFHSMYVDTEVISLAKVLNIPIVYTVHDFFHICDSFNLISHEGKYCGIGEDVFRAPCLQCSASRGISEKLFVQRRLLWNQALSKCDLIVHGSIESIEITERVYGSTKGLQRVVAPQLNWHKDIEIAEKKENYLVFLGNFSSNKGADLILQLIESNLIDSYSLEVFGRVDTPYIERLEKCESSLTKLNIYGEYRPPIRAHGSIAIFASVWPETFCLTATEAKKMELKLVLPYIGAFKSRFQNDLNVFFYTPGDIISLWQAIETANKTSYVVGSTLDLESHSYAEKYLSIYQEIISRKPTAAQQKYQLQTESFISTRWLSIPIASGATAASISNNRKLFDYISLSIRILREQGIKIFLTKLRRFVMRKFLR